MSSLKKETLCVVGLIFFGMIFFYKTIYFGFINIDDPLHTYENIAVMTFDIKSLLTKYYVGLYHPLTSLSFAIDWWLGDSKPWIFHLSNIIFHILATLILLKLCLKLWPKRFVLAFLISLTFLLHPLKAESVAWITERKDILSGLFLWLTIYLYLIYLEQKKLWKYILANLAFLLALSGKVSVVPLPIFLFVIDWYRDQKLGFRSIVNKAPFFIMALTFGLLNVLEQSRKWADVTMPKKSYYDLFYQIHFYLEKSLYPWDLRVWYSREFLNFNPLGVTSIALICLLAILIVRKYSAHMKDLVLGLSLFVLFIFPNAKIITPGDANLVNDRYMYIALTGLTFAFFPFIAQSIEDLWRA